MLAYNHLSIQLKFAEIFFLYYLGGSLIFEFRLKFNN